MRTKLKLMLCGFAFAAVAGSATPARAWVDCECTGSVYFSSYPHEWYGQCSPETTVWDEWQCAVWCHDWVIVPWARTQCEGKEGDQVQITYFAGEQCLNPWYSDSEWQVCGSF